MLKRVSFGDAVVNVIDECEFDQGMPRLFVQGLCCAAEVIWRPLFAELRRSGDQRRFIAVDPRGVEGSTGFPASLVQSSDDLVAVVRALGAAPVELIGHSLGGLTAMLMAARNPDLVRSLVLIDTAPTFSPKTRSGFVWRSQSVLENNDVSAILDTVLPRSFSPDSWSKRQPTIERFRRMLASQRPDVYSQLCAIAATGDVRNELRAIDLPALVVVGSDDVSTPPALMRQIADMLKAGFVVVPGAGHNTPLEQPSAVASALLRGPSPKASASF